MFTLTCPECASEVSLSPRHLLVRVDDEPATAGELLFTCLACHRTPAVPLNVAAVAALVTSGVTFLTMSPHIAGSEWRPGVSGL